MTTDHAIKFPMKKSRSPKRILKIMTSIMHVEMLMMLAVMFHHQPYCHCLIRSIHRQVKIVFLFLWKRRIPVTFGY